MRSAGLHGPAASRLYEAAVNPKGFLNSTYSGTLDHSGDCTFPKIVSNSQRSIERPDGSVMPPVEMVYAVRCRSCPNCQRAKRLHWVLRALPELVQAQRTWFVTLTFSLAMHYRFIANPGKDHLDQAYGEVQKMFKRMRKTDRKEFRYLAVTERHKSGFPHFHMLLHEKPGSPAIGNRELSGNQAEDITPKWWVDKEGQPMGHVHCRLIRIGEVLPGKTRPLSAVNAAFYVCKYIGKDPVGRVKSSLKYGGGRGGGFAPPSVH